MLDASETSETSEAFEVEESLGVEPESPTEEEKIHLPQQHEQGSLSFLKPEDRALFEPGLDPGYVRDDPKNGHRRLVQRTIMLSEAVPRYGAVLTFDDQLIPFTQEESSAMAVAQDLQRVSARGIFFANVPGVSKFDVDRILRSATTSEAAVAASRALLDERRALFVQAMVDLLEMKNEGSTLEKPRYTNEVYNHTAYHQDMRSLKEGSARLAVCLDGIVFLEECLIEAYAKARPGFERVRWFRFPFLHDPERKAVKEAVIETFNQLGLLSLGETQDSKDVLNLSADKAYRSLEAAKKGRRYNVAKGGVYSRTEQPVALFHTKTWRKIGRGVLRAIPPVVQGAAVKTVP